MVYLRDLTIPILLLPHPHEFTALHLYYSGEVQIIQSWTVVSKYVLSYKQSDKLSNVFDSVTVYISHQSENETLVIE